MINVRVSVEEAFDLVFRCVRNNGCDHENSSAIAEVVTAAERDGCRSHGLFRVPGYVTSLRNRKVNGCARPSICQNSASVTKIDGYRGYAPLALKVGLSRVLEGAKEQPISALCITNCFHYGPLWFELEQAAEAGFVVFGFLPSAAQVAPAGSTRPFLGTDPMGFGWPRTDGDSMIIDQSTAVKARGDIMIAAQQGKSLPFGVGLDRGGAPTTDPHTILNGGVQLPFGGYKGTSLGIMTELLGSALLGSDFGFEARDKDNRDGGPTLGGELLLLLNPGYFNESNCFNKRCETFFSTLSAKPGVRLPGDRRRLERRKSLQHGIQISSHLVEKIRELSTATS